MSGTNDFQPFATGGGANVLSQADYLALAALATGFQAGTAQSAALNKVWRQSSIMSSVLAQLIVDLTGQNATDDGTTATLLANLKQALIAGGGGIARFTSSTSWTVPAGVTQVWATGVPAGGAGGSGGAGSVSSTAAWSAGGGGGGAGQPIIRVPYLVVPLSVVNITIPAAATGGAAPTSGNGNNGASGGSLVISGTGFNGGTPVTLPGGNGGSGGLAVTASNAAGGAGGAGFPSGTYGSDTTANNASGTGGMGASSPFGGGGGAGRGAAGGGIAGASGYGFGSGGGGGGGVYIAGGGNGGAGGNSGPGFLIFEW
ncbi:phage tail protein [Burkholderia cenocepacia]|uniref:phage tail protein n=1 Tax=Burkholderia cenocepacia TaxID=95486 RepID=UPI0020117FCF|nr:phage tail protein [Burkholderia cenocepacia]